MEIVIIGAGNLATNLAHTLSNHHNIVQIVSRTKMSAENLAKSLDAKYCVGAEDIYRLADLYIIATNDDSIFEIAKGINFKDKTIVHTAGSINIDVLNDFMQFGVFYPLQTFSKNKIIDFTNIPICIEANNIETENKLLEVAGTISSNVHIVSSEQRKYLHLSAVFACNFTNHLYNLANDILREKNIDFEILKPLIIETANKIIENNPNDAQTGPAIRKDKIIIAKHLELLSLNSNLLEIYNKLTESIIEKHK